jgi:hypothetical protein
LGEAQPSKKSLSPPLTMLIAARELWGHWSEAGGFGRGIS